MIRRSITETYRKKTRLRGCKNLILLSSAEHEIGITKNTNKFNYLLFSCGEHEIFPTNKVLQCQQVFAFAWGSWQCLFAKQFLYSDEFGKKKFNLTSGFVLTFKGHHSVVTIPICPYISLNWKFINQLAVDRASIFLHVIIIIVCEKCKKKSPHILGISVLSNKLTKK